MTTEIRQTYPILEYDEGARAVIEPRRPPGAPTIAEHCVICFFSEAIGKLVKEGKAAEITSLRSEMGPHPVLEVDVAGKPVALFHPGVGAPLAAGLLEEVIALGAREFVVYGGAGVLDKGIACGHLLVPVSAVRDEGTSYHYLPPSREVGASPEAVAAIERTLQKRGYPYLLSKTWTTDAFYRETPGKVALRRSEGCLTVEMEAAALYAVARFRGVKLGQILYGGDDVSGTEWDHRDWDQRGTVREQLLWLAAEAVLEV